LNFIKTVMVSKSGLFQNYQTELAAIVEMHVGKAIVMMKRKKKDESRKEAAVAFINETKK